jgi:small subunit ribosomal protein S23
MGRLNLTAINVRRAALEKFKSKQIRGLPAWVDIVHDVPPAQILVRQQPAKHPLTKIRTRTLPNGKTEQYAQVSEARKSKAVKARRVFQPKQIRYEEDSLRHTFFSDHPWELARPRVIVETSGNQHINADWSTGIQQPGIPLSGECVVQRQLWLLENVPDISVPQAYDVARKEFYTLRRREERRDRIAAEEARHMGATFGQPVQQIALGIENAMYNDWEKWSRQVVMEQTSRLVAFEGTAAKDEPKATGEAMPRGASQPAAVGAGVFAEEESRANQWRRRS